jgi:hypothetical protein
MASWIRVASFAAQAPLVPSWIGIRHVPAGKGRYDMVVQDHTLREKCVSFLCRRVTDGRLDMHGMKLYFGDGTEMNVHAMSELLDPLLGAKLGQPWEDPAPVRLYILATCLPVLRSFAVPPFLTQVVLSTGRVALCAFDTQHLESYYLALLDLMDKNHDVRKWRWYFQDGSSSLDLTLSSANRIHRLGLLVDDAADPAAFTERSIKECHVIATCIAREHLPIKEQAPFLSLVSLDNARTALLIPDRTALVLWQSVIRQLVDLLLISNVEWYLNDGTSWRHADNSVAPPVDKLGAPFAGTVRCEPTAHAEAHEVAAPARPVFASSKKDVAISPVVWHDTTHDAAELKTSVDNLLLDQNIKGRNHAPATTIPEYDNILCVDCQIEPAMIFALPCEHVVLCQECAGTYTTRDTRVICPDCKKPVTEWCSLDMDRSDDRVEKYLVPVDAMAPLSDDDASTGDEKQEFYFEDANDMGDL